MNRGKNQNALRRQLVLSAYPKVLELVKKGVPICAAIKAVGKCDRSFFYRVISKEQKSELGFWKTTTNASGNRCWGDKTKMPMTLDVEEEDD